MTWYCDMVYLYIPPVMGACIVFVFGYRWCLGRLRLARSRMIFSKKRGVEGLFGRADVGVSFYSTTQLFNCTRSNVLYKDPRRTDRVFFVFRDSWSEFFRCLPSTHNWSVAPSWVWPIKNLLAIQSGLKNDAFKTPLKTTITHSPCDALVFQRDSVYRLWTMTIRSSVYYDQNGRG